MSSKNNSWDSICPLKIKQQNQNEITKLYNTLRPYFLNFFVQNEELYNDFVLKVVFEIETFRSQSKFSTWVFTIANNLFLNHIEKEKVRKKREKLIAEAYKFMLDQEPNSENSIELEVLLDQLKPNQKVFLQNYIQNKALFTDQRHKFSYTIKKLKQFKNQSLAA
jgi:RNA polymerase sigma factor (sigma-70 family)